MTKSQGSPTARLGLALRVVLVCAWVAFIWGHSLVPGDPSEMESLGVSRFLAPAFATFGVTDIDTVDHVVRKIAHFLEYTMLGILLVVAARPEWRVRDAGHESWPRRVISILAGVLVPSVDETIQTFVPGRSGMVSDVALDCSGVATGMFLASAVLGARARRGLGSGPRA